MFFGQKSILHRLQKQVVGLNKNVPLINGNKVRYINLDNAASTPILKPVIDRVYNFMEIYSSVHRGAGYKSLLSTQVYEECHQSVAEFVRANPEENTVIFVKNTTEAINKLANRLDFSKRDMVITTLMEHHSNDLPWRQKAKVVYAELDSHGALDMNDLEDKIKKYGSRIRLVAVTGASNVTGFTNDIHTIAKMAHRCGAEIFVDAAQLAPHRAIDVFPNDHPGHIDYLAFSAHKIYAPLGTGVLIGPKSTFKKGNPDYVGGGTIESVTLTHTYWAQPPEKEEAGSPNLVGAVALKESLDVLKEVGMEEIEAHDRELMAYTINSFKNLDGITLYGSLDPHEKNRVGVVTFNIDGLNHALVASILSFEGGIGVRNGCFCAHPYVHRLLNMSNKEILYSQKKILSKDKEDLPGMVRISFGFYNTKKDIDILMNILEEINRQKHNGVYFDRYHLNRSEGFYYPKNHSIPLK